VASLTIPVRVQPRSSRSEIVGVRDGVLVVRVTAPPLDGRANDAVCRLLATCLRVRTSSVAIVRGERSRDKLVRVEGVDAREARATLWLPADDAS
jgi:hypothetical protein